MTLCYAKEAAAPSGHRRRRGRDCRQRYASSFATQRILYSEQDGIDVIYMLLNGGVYVDECDYSGYTALHRAASAGDLNLATFLLERGARIDASDWGLDGGSPLHVAVCNNNVEVAKLLIERGTFVNICNGKRAPA